MPGLADVRSLLADEHGLAVVSTVQRDGRVLSSVANCGVLAHPVGGHDCVSFVSHGDAARLGHIRAGSEVTVTVRRGWRWVGVTGPAELIGPIDPADGIDEEALRLLLRRIFEAAGGRHDDWGEYDRVMAAEQRTAVLVSANRIIGNG